jgi:hypothetical protein
MEPISNETRCQGTGNERWNCHARLCSAFSDALRDLPPLSARAFAGAPQCVAHRAPLADQIRKKLVPRTRRCIARSPRPRPVGVESRSHSRTAFRGGYRPDTVPSSAPRSDVHANLLERGKPLGAMRPASARLPCQSASSFMERVNSRPAVSVQVSPSAALKVLRSESPPSL